MLPRNDQTVCRCRYPTLAHFLILGSFSSDVRIRNLFPSIHPAKKYYSFGTAELRADNTTVAYCHFLWWYWCGDVLHGAWSRINSKYLSKILEKPLVFILNADLKDSRIKKYANPTFNQPCVNTKTYKSFNYICNMHIRYIPIYKWEIL